MKRPLEKEKKTTQQQQHGKNRFGQWLINVNRNIRKRFK